MCPIVLFRQVIDEAFGLLQVLESIQEFQGFVEFAHVLAEQLIHVQQAVVDGQGFGQVAEGLVAEFIG
jgi:hypothetical protein